MSNHGLANLRSYWEPGALICSTGRMWIAVHNFVIYSRCSFLPAFLFHHCHQLSYRRLYISSIASRLERQYSRHHGKQYLRDLPEWRTLVRWAMPIMPQLFLTIDRYTCEYQSPTFFGCCVSNPCNENGCPAEDLRAAGMGKSYSALGFAFIWELS